MGRTRSRPIRAACVEDGLSFLHFHARDPETGEQLWTDADSYKQSILGMRQLGVPAGLPWYPTYGGLDRQRLRPYRDAGRRSRGRPADGRRSISAPTISTILTR